MANERDKGTGDTESIGRGIDDDVANTSDDEFEDDDDMDDEDEEEGEDLQ